MKITVKTLTNEQFTVDVPNTATVLDAKTAIQGVRGETYAASLQKLIHAGKVLKDESTLEESGVKDGTFLVCMVSKPKVVRLLLLST
jgi:UV excision repair protein RAD23